MLVDLSKSTTAWSTSMKLRRAAWTYGLEPLVRWLPNWCSPVRVAALRAMGAQIGPHCRITPGVKVLMPWNLHMQEHVALGRGVDVYNFAPVRIARHTVVSQGSYLCTGSHDFRQAHMPLTYQPIDIGAGCWLAAQVFVCPGVSIPDGVVVGARSVVTRSLPTPWAVYAGNPCVQVGTREMRG